MPTLCIKIIRVLYLHTYITSCFELTFDVVGVEPLPFCTTPQAVESLYHTEDKTYHTYEWLYVNKNRYH